ncbi:hypothetical protein GCM10028808_28190 [Spirosoma migulaei]
MKNEDRIIELLAETLQRIDRHNEEIARVNKKFDLHSEQFEQNFEQLEHQQEQIGAIIGQIQKHQERLDRHGEAFGSLRERTEAIHQSALEQQKAYQAMTELLMHHNRALVAKGIL